MPHDWAVGAAVRAAAARRRRTPTAAPRTASRRSAAISRRTASAGTARRSPISAADRGRRIWLEFDGVFRDCHRVRERLCRRPQRERLRAVPGRDRRFPRLRRRAECHHRSRRREPRRGLVLRRRRNLPPRRAGQRRLRCTSRNGARSCAARSRAGRSVACKSRPTCSTAATRRPMRQFCVSRCSDRTGRVVGDAAGRRARSGALGSSARSSSRCCSERRSCGRSKTATSIHVRSEIWSSELGWSTAVETRFGIRDDRLRPRARILPQRRAGEAARHLQPPRPCGRRHRHSRRAASLAGRAAQGDGLERLAERAQPAGFGAARRVRRDWAC